MNHKQNETMTHTHTPGPWHIGKRAADVAIYGPKGEEVAKILGFFNDDEENKANARLISASPNLLEALQMLLPQEPREPDSYDRAMWENARAAIAKATGKEDA
jgi:hypothetical protein